MRSKVRILMSLRFRKESLAALGAVLGFAIAAAGIAETVPGSSNPFLAGMPNGSLCCSGDAAPAQSPVLVTSFVIVPGSGVTFTVTGSVDNTGAPPTLSPDGGSVFTTSNSNGIAGATWPINALVGVFLDNSQPDSSAAPSSLDFSSGAGTGFTTLSPALKQAFFIGDGRTGTGTGSVQNFVVPAGATRLFLGTSDGVGWFNNSGSFTVTVLAGIGVPTPTPTATPPPTLTPTPTRTLTPVVASVTVPTLSLPLLALLGIALGAAALFLIRRT